MSRASRSARALPVRHAGALLLLTVLGCLSTSCTASSRVDGSGRGPTSVPSPQRGSRPSSAPTMLSAPSGAESPPIDELGIAQLPSRVVLHDRTGDVYRIDDSRRVSRVQRSSVDVTGMSVLHGAGSVQIRLRFADLRPGGQPTFDIGFYTPAGRYFLDLTLRRARVPELPQQFVAPSGDQLGCPGFRRRLDVAADLLSVTVPRACLDAPVWVKVRVLISEPTVGGTVYENPHNSRPFSEFATSRLYPG